MVVKLFNYKRNHSSLIEATRKDLLFKSRRGSKTRFKKRLNYQVSNFRGVDLSELFNHDYFIFNTPIKDYVCTIAYEGVLSELREVVKSTHGDPRRINLQMVIKALSRSFDKSNDVKVRCTCPDFKYRFMYWANENDYLYGPLTKGTEKFPEITNPDDMLGATCKHLDLLLSNKRWLTRAASSVNALVKTYPDKAAIYLYDEEEIVEPEEDEVDKVEKDPETSSEENSSSEEDENDQSQNRDEEESSETNQEDND